MRGKKGLMVVLWRVQQSQMVISIVFWSLTLTGVFYPYVAGYSPLGPLSTMGLLFIGVIGSVLAFGYAYDRLRFWDEQMRVQLERNPNADGVYMTYMQYRLFAPIVEPTEENLEAARRLIAYNLDDQERAEAWARLDNTVSKWRGKVER
jgi:hypothetical protein